MTEAHRRVPWLLLFLLPQLALSRGAAKSAAPLQRTRYQEDCSSDEGHGSSSADEVRRNRGGNGGVWADAAPQPRISSSTPAPRMRPPQAHASAERAASGVQWIVTAQMRRELRALGYTEEEVGEIRPEVARVVLERGLGRPRSGMPRAWRTSSERPRRRLLGGIPNPLPALGRAACAPFGAAARALAGLSAVVGQLGPAASQAAVSAFTLAALVALKSAAQHHLEGGAGSGARHGNGAGRAAGAAKSATVSWRAKLPGRGATLAGGGCSGGERKSGGGEDGDEELEFH